jgi:hypothetical protein
VRVYQIKNTETFMPRRASKEAPRRGILIKINFSSVFIVPERSNSIRSVYKKVILKKSGSPGLF